MTVRRISDEQVDRAIELLRAGIVPSAAARATGMGLRTLYDHLGRRGLTTKGAPGWVSTPRRGHEADRARRATALEMREGGSTFVEIGNALDITRQAARLLWVSALRERGRQPSRPEPPVRVPERQVRSHDRLERLQRARLGGGTCGWCDRALEDGETVYVDIFRIVVKPPLRPGRASWHLRAPVGAECAAPGLLASLAGQQPEPCVGCGHGVYFRQVHASRKRTTCSRRCQYT